jgi:tetratricopeptide (TPR) repeat protein
MAEGSKPETERDHAHWDAVEEIAEIIHEGSYDEALVLLREVLKQDPKNPYAYHLLGIALYELGQIEAARDAYRATLAIAPDHLGARVHLSHVYRELGDTKNAITQGMEALRRFPGDSDALHAVGLAYHARGDVAAARKYLEAFLETGPELEVGTEVRALLQAMELERREPD